MGKNILVRFNGRRSKPIPVRINDHVLEKDIQRLRQAGFKQSQLVKAGLVVVAGMSEEELRRVVKQLFDGRKW